MDADPRILVAGMGNVLCADDGFGVAVAAALAARPLPPRVEVMEVGIGGIHLVQQLFAGYDALVVLDTVDRGAPPGVLFELEPDVPDLANLADDARSELLADMHYAVPARALAMAKALGVLPSRVRIVGCQGQDVAALEMGMTELVRRCVPVAVARVEAIIRRWRAGADPERAEDGRIE